ncbi:gp436 family protein [Comamonas sp. NLF-1-9]|uniref:gp436 family protein n=1 Tax=Comamonas sp. NLF-1-9 TaxID=2853163 RepID=UPI001C449A66|nr:DUF1320 domain-containing protein [Comamonas sp. NLF-1-9]QXL84096.1 DUF1320 domain-containing protein [Comamonas sp. NLF-1-9]
MNYASVQDLIDRFGEPELIQLTDPLEQASVQQGRAQRALDDAHALADGLLSRVYVLPLAGCAKPAPEPGNPQAVQLVAPPQLTRIVCDIARYYLYDDVAPDNAVAQRYKQARAELDLIAAGDATLTCPWGGEPGERLQTGKLGEGESLFQFYPRSVADDVSGGYR